MDDIVVSSPGKIILHGEHAVVYGKVALATCLNLRTYLRVRASPDKQTIHVDLPDIDRFLVWKISEIKSLFSLPACDPLKPHTPSTDLFKKLARFVGIDDETHDTKRLALLAFLYLLCSISGSEGLPAVHITVTSKLPVSAGLGSSAGYSACLAAGLLLHAKLISPGGETEDTWDNSELELINRWAFQAEKIIHGNPSGIDNSVCTYGGAVQFQSGNIEKLEKVPELRILLVDTKLPRSTKVLVARVRNKLNKYPEIIKPVMDSIEGVSQLCKETLRKLQKSTEEAYKTLEELIDINQHHLSVLGVSHPAIDQICAISLKYGLHSKLTGAGGGGCVFTLIPPTALHSTIEDYQQELIEGGYNCWQTSIGGEGVRHHANSTATDTTVPDIDVLKAVYNGWKQ